MKSLKEILEAAERSGDFVNAIEERKALIAKIKTDAASAAQALRSNEDPTTDEIKRNTELVDGFETESRQLEDEIIELENARSAFVAERNAMIDVKNDNKTATRGLDLETYKNSEDAVEDFADALKEAEERRLPVREVYPKVVSEKRGLAITGTYTPQVLQGRVTSTFDTYGKIRKAVKTVRLPKGTAIYQGLIKVMPEKAFGHKSGTQKSEITPAAKSIQILTDMVYQKASFDRKDVLTNPQSVIDVLTSMIPASLALTIDEAIILGDGRLDTADDKITQIKPIVRANDAFVTNIETAAIDTISYQDYLTAKGNINTMSKAGNGLKLVLSDSVLTEMLKETNSVGSTVWGQGAGDINAGFANFFKGVEIQVVDFMPTLAEAMAGDVPAFVVYDANSYVLVEGSNLLIDDMFNLDYNTESRLMEQLLGGNLDTEKSACVVQIKKI